MWTGHKFLLIYFISFTLWKQDWLIAPAERQLQKTSTGLTDKCINLTISLVEAPSYCNSDKIKHSLVEKRFIPNYFYITCV